MSDIDHRSTLLEVISHLIYASFIVIRLLLLLSSIRKCIRLSSCRVLQGTCQSLSTALLAVFSFLVVLLVRISVSAPVAITSMKNCLNIFVVRGIGKSLLRIGLSFPNASQTSLICPLISQLWLSLDVRFS